MFLASVVSVFKFVLNIDACAKEAMHFFFYTIQASGPFLICINFLLLFNNPSVKLFFFIHTVSLILEYHDQICLPSGPNREFVERENGTPGMQGETLNLFSVHSSGMGSGAWKPLVASHGRH